MKIPVKKEKKEKKENKEEPVLQNKEQTEKEEQEKEKKKKQIQMYSEIGYVHVDKAEYEDTSMNLISFEKKNHKLEGKLSKQKLTDKINVHLKTLYGSRRVYTFNVFVNSKLSILIDKLVDEEVHSNEKIKWNSNFQYRLISTNGLIKELNPMMSFAEEEIKNDFTIILATPYKILFSETMKHQGIYVSHVYF